MAHRYAYDKAGKLAAVAFDGQQVGFSYDKSRLAQVAFPNAAAAYAYNAGGWLTAIATRLQETTLLSRQYGFDAVGN